MHCARAVEASLWVRCQRGSMWVRATEGWTDMADQHRHSNGNSLHSRTEAALPDADALLDYVADHARQLASLALAAGRPQASALITLAVTQLGQEG